jgi:putative endonuclease
MANTPKPKPQAAVIGQFGEVLVAQWLAQQGWTVIARGWRSRWGELDIVALRSGDCNCLAFVEVKTRSPGNWDEGGLSAITRAKQIKLWKTAQLFLAQHPDLAEVPCRFDVALVSVGRSQLKGSSSLNSPIQLGQLIQRDGYELSLQTYLEAAFELSDS